MSEANILSTSAQVVIAGTAGDDWLAGSDTADILQGEDGHDNLQGGLGEDELYGGAGNDELIGGAGNDLLDGGAGRDKLFGNSGDDVYVLNGVSGFDEIFDSIGNDTIDIDGSPAEVSFSVIPDTTILLIQLGDAIAAVRGFFSESDEGRIENFAFSDGTIWHREDVLAALEAQNPPPSEDPPPNENPIPPIVGTAGNDVLTGTSQGELIEGYAGNDTLDGGAGEDALAGGLRNDVYIWQAGKGSDLILDIGGIDTLRIAAKASDVTLALDDDLQSLTITLGSEVLTIAYYFVRGESDEEEGHIETITFSDGTVWRMENVLAALGRTPGTNPGTPSIPSTPVVSPTPEENSPDDSLPDGAVDDNILAGTAGRDVLTGGVDADIFCFSNRADVGLGKKRDVIVNFEHGADKIDLSGIDANMKAAGNNAFTSLLTGKKPFTKAGQLHYDKKTGVLSGNTDKDAAAEFQIQLKNKPALLKLSDFIL